MPGLLARWLLGSLLRRRQVCRTHRGVSGGDIGTGLLWAHQAGTGLRGSGREVGQGGGQASGRCQLKGVEEAHGRLREGSRVERVSRAAASGQGSKRGRWTRTWPAARALEETGGGYGGSGDRWCPGGFSGLAAQELLLFLPRRCLTRLTFVAQWALGPGEAGVKGGMNAGRGVGRVGPCLPQEAPVSQQAPTGNHFCKGASWPGSQTQSPLLPATPLEFASQHPAPARSPVASPPRLGSHENVTFRDVRIKSETCATWKTATAVPCFLAPPRPPVAAAPQLCWGR